MRSLFFLFCLVASVNAYKVLLFSPIFGHSHTNFLGRLADILTDRGHNVTVVMPVMEPKLISKTGLKSTKNPIILEADPRVVEIMSTQAIFFSRLWTMKPDPMSMLSMSKLMVDMFQFACESVINNDTLIESLRNEKFDIGFAEPFQFCGFGLLEILNVPSTVGALSTIHMDLISSAIGEPLAPSYVPGMTSTSGERMTFFERMGNFIGGMIGNYVFKSVQMAEHALFVQKFGPNFRSYENILADMNYLFTNANPYLNYPRPVLHKTVEIGSITVDIGKKAPKLDEEWDKILSERSKTVLVSFGSVAKSKDMPQSYKDNLLKLFAAMPDVTFIWKYEEDSNMADHLPNVHLSQWMPQVALLNDPRLTLFVTHGGLGSTTELSHLGKPAIFIPLFAEQPRNAAMLSRHGGSTYLYKEDLNDAKKLEETIRKVLEDPSYAENAKKLADLLNNQPIDVVEKFVKHMDFAAKFGRISNLDPYGRHLSVIQYYLVDVVLFILAVVTVVLFVVFCSLRCLVRKCCGSTKVEKSKKD